MLSCLLVCPPVTADVLGSGPPLTHRSYSVDAALLSDCVSTAAIERDADFVMEAESACVGQGFTQCSEMRNDRVTMITCLSLERQYWEWRLDRMVEGLSGAYSPPEFVQGVQMTAPELQATVIVWRAYAETKCSYLTSQYGVGRSRGREGDIVEYACLNGETARFSLEIENRLKEHCRSGRRPVYGEICEDLS
ncbi:hypothetical protein BC777_1139 [Yoonia maricola]|uniref:Lysozyme inhibitor LprI-like N-terminal domain-containing protein n=2 Tax=Yoonia maricola TaxID=420999 RepID=A0A2M8WN00_9RHOB|nr:hypothetical protein BC777_1139 [Yoonia maricola]